MCVYLSICLLQMVGSGPGVAGGVGMGKLETRRQKVESRKGRARSGRSGTGGRFFFIFAGGAGQRSTQEIAEKRGLRERVCPLVQRRRGVELGFAESEIKK